MSAFLCFSVNAISQEDEAGVAMPPKLKAAIGFGYGFLTENTASSQLQASFGYRPFTQPIEFRLDGTYFLGNSGERPRFSINHQLYLGAFYQFLTSRSIQPYLGLQGGIAYSQSSEYGTLDTTTGELTYQKTVNPVGSGVLGVDLFAQQGLYGFLETRYILGRHTSDTYPIYLDELRFTLGIGFKF